MLLHEVCSFRRGLTWRKEQEAAGPSGDTLPVLRIPNVQERLVPNDLLHLRGIEPVAAAKAKVGGGWTVMVGSNGNPKRVGNCVLLKDNQEFVFASFLLAVGTSDPSQVAPEFLFRLLRSERVQTTIAEQVQGSTGLKNINLPALKSLPVAIPPLPEQRKIVAILSSVDEEIEATQAVIDQLQVVKKAIMAELLMRGLPRRHSTFIESEIGIIPQGWTTATYAELAAPVHAAIQSGPFGSALRHSEFVAGGRLVVGIDNVLDGRFSLGSNHRITREKFEELRRFQARPLDLLITVMATIGRCCVVPANVEPCIITKHVYRLSVDPSKADPFFLMHCLYGIERLAAEVRGSAQGLSRPGLNKSLLLPLRFPLPPLAEQREIVAVLRSLDERFVDEVEALSAMRLLKAALMNALLSGEVRVGPGQEAA